VYLAGLLYMSSLVLPFVYRLSRAL
jgi:hypothetical protein